MSARCRKVCRKHLIRAFTAPVAISATSPLGASQRRRHTPLHVSPNLRDAWKWRHPWSDLPQAELSMPMYGSATNAPIVSQRASRHSARSDIGFLDTFLTFCITAQPLIRLSPPPPPLLDPSLLRCRFRQTPSFICGDVESAEATAVNAE